MYRMQYAAMMVNASDCTQVFHSNSHMSSLYTHNGATFQFIAHLQFISTIQTYEGYFNQHHLLDSLTVPLHIHKDPGMSVEGLSGWKKDYTQDKMPTHNVWYMSASNKRAVACHDLYNFFPFSSPHLLFDIGSWWG